MNPQLNALFSQLQEIAHLTGIGSLLSWDQETYMPAGAIDARSEQSALMSKIVHEKMTSLALKSTLGQLININSGELIATGLTPRESRLVTETYRDWKMANCLPVDFVEAFSKVKAHSQHAWQHARQNKDFSHFLPYLEEVVNLTRKKADYLGVQSTVYDTLLDEYEPGMTTAEISPVFTRLREATVQLVKDIQTKQSSIKLPAIQGPFDTQKQWDFGIKILKDMGYNFEHGRQDKSTHPFTTQFHPTDVRITTRLNPDDLFDALSSTIHEGGHALYEQGLDAKWFGTPLCQPISFGIHESQSRLWENGIGKSKAFWEGYYPYLQTLFHESLRTIPLRDFYQSMLKVSPSLIRVGADEVTYNLHILIRFEIEKMIFNDGVSVKDLPQIWNQKYQEYLGITPPNDAEGILQDVHWSCGYFGYFPTYTLGNLYSVQLLNQAQKEMPHFDQTVQEGKLSVITEWLRNKVHSVGRGKTASQLMREITGQGISEEPFVRYLEGRYL